GRLGAAAGGPRAGARVRAGDPQTAGREVPPRCTRTRGPAHGSVRRFRGGESELRRDAGSREPVVPQPAAGTVWSDPRAGDGSGRFVRRTGDERERPWP